MFVFVSAATIFGQSDQTKTASTGWQGKVVEEVEVDGIVDSAICMKEITEICEDIYTSRNESIQTKNRIEMG